ncbi:low choriolytic enzyme-like isoform X2 [Melanotaenia boesemani]|uniref:low choriolytic enzyme-like isoform X2 n=1 Tax=Melanotaenia boesemani TaxID=1250792 RepID=UPI001C04A6F3|nr:low choriolytic enzyme-like isoform X2 [Melanotaenia boesemani]
MTPTFLFLLILSLTDVSMSAPIDSEDQTGQSMDIMLRPQIDPKSPVLEDDIALPDTSSRNADPCTATGCKWPKTGHKVYVPYYISTNYTPVERYTIIKGLQSFIPFTCIRFVAWKPDDHHYLSFESRDGCWSYVGRQENGQIISLEKPGCVYHSTVQHEVLHALGFHHEQKRSDRDEYIRILFENIKPEFKHNFDKVETNNLMTPYDFNSVMQYNKYVFSKNEMPTMVAKCDPNLDFGHATEMNKNDIIRVNRLYNCCSKKTPCTISN